MEQQKENLFDLRIEPETGEILRDAAKWARLLAILGFIFIGIMVLFGIYITFTLAAVSRYTSGLSAFVGLFYVLMAALYFMPTLWLFKFGRLTIHAIDGTDQDGLNRGFSNLKSSFKFIGILALVGLGLMVTFIIIGLFGVLMAAT